MAHDSHEAPSIVEHFEFSSTFKRNLIIAAIAGIAMVLVGVFLINKGWNIGGDGFLHNAHGGEGEHGAGGEHHGATLMSRVIANLWMNGVYFTGLAVVGMFFISYNYLAQAGWSVAIKRVAEATPAFLPFTGALLLVLYIFFKHDIFHWTHKEIYDATSPHYDKIIAGKKWWLNEPFWLIRFALYFIGWYGLWYLIRKNSLREDNEGGLALHDKNVVIATVFILFFGVTSSTSAWDLSMSIDTHWFSTMFGWYHLASWHVAGLAVMMLTVLLLKDRGYLQAVNENHLHDLGKLMFGFSIFWTYVWFSQFLLIYYAHLPEETIYFRERFTGFDGRYKVPFFVNLLLNFVAPFLILMARKAKRTPVFLKIACVAIIVGHWFDFYQMHMPGIAKDQGNIGLIEWGTTLTFASLFIYSVANQLSKANLIPTKHPFLEESLHHDI